MSEVLFTAESPLEAWPELGRELGVELSVKRDDLLPFPLAGNKFRKLYAEYRDRGWARGDVLISNGGIDSNHCRTLAMFGARLGCSVHLVLHGDPRVTPDRSVALRMLDNLGASYEIVDSTMIAEQLDRAERTARARAERVWVVPGGAHTPAGVRAYRDVARAVLTARPVDFVVLPSGTGATQAGIILGAHDAGAAADVLGVSVARSSARGAEAVRECLTWFTSAHLPVHFDDRFADGGYARTAESTRATVAWAWRHGLPLDTTYTGKAFKGLRIMLERAEITRGSRVLFWHTGGLANHLATLLKGPDS